MANITGSIRIAATPERVFDAVADSRLEPSFNPAMGEVELLSPEPIGLGTRFRARMANTGAEMLIELTAFDPPRQLASRTTSSMMETTGTLTCIGDDGSTLLSWDWQVHPKGRYRLMSPFVGLFGHRMERKIWTGLKHKIEAEALPSTM
jgi:uncharacterized protein YndB with AHSA1/START domain